MSAVTLSGIGCLLSIAVLIYLAYNRCTPAVFVGCAILVHCLFSQMDIYKTFTEPYMTGVAGFVKSYFLMFMVSSIFGRIYQDTGAAQSLGEGLANIFGAKRAILVMLIAIAALTYGGVSGFVAIFALYPIGLVMFEKANYTKMLFPGLAALGMWTFAMTGPGTPQLQNIIPIATLNTTPTAALVPGAIGAIAMAVMGYFYMMFAAKQYEKKGIGFDAHADLEKMKGQVDDADKRPKLVLTFIPIVFVLVAFNGFNVNIIVTLVLACILSFILFFKTLSLKQWLDTLQQGIIAMLPVIINTSLVIGYGSVSRETPFFKFAVEWAGQSSLNPYFLTAFAANIFGGILGSATGGIGLTMSALADLFKKYIDMGYSPEALHRLAVQSVGGLDSLPHCGAIITVLAVCGLTHKEAYKHIFWTTVAIPIFVSFLIVLPLCLVMYPPM